HAARGLEGVEPGPGEERGVFDPVEGVPERLGDAADGGVDADLDGHRRPRDSAGRGLGVVAGIDSPRDRTPTGPQHGDAIAAPRPTPTSRTGATSSSAARSTAG